MHGTLKFLTLNLTALVLAAVLTTSAQAQVFYAPQVYAQPPVVSYSYYQGPGVSYYAPAYATTAYSYSSPVPFAAYSSPLATYSSPLSVTAYSNGAVYSSAYATPGYVTTRSYVGLGVFRPRGVYTQSYYSPGVVVPSRSYYSGYIYP